ncbi:MAG: YdeI/OmpD-associated family protein [Myxococcota bacterium]
MSSVQILAPLERGTRKDTLGLVLPEASVLALGGGKRPPVAVTVQGYTWRSTVAPMGGRFLVGIAKEHREHLALDGLDAVEVELRLDTEPRVTPVPPDLAEALASAGRTAAFDALAPSRRKEAVRQVEEAKTAATRERRIAKIVDGLGAP